MHQPVTSHKPSHHPTQERRSQPTHTLQIDASALSRAAAGYLPPYTSRQVYCMTPELNEIHWRVEILWSQTEEAFVDHKLSNHPEGYKYLSKVEQRLESLKNHLQKQPNQTEDLQRVQKFLLRVTSLKRNLEDTKRIIEDYNNQLFQRGLSLFASQAPSTISFEDEEAKNELQKLAKHLAIIERQLDALKEKLPNESQILALRNRLKSIEQDYKDIKKVTELEDLDPFKQKLDKLFSILDALSSNPS